MDKKDKKIKFKIFDITKDGKGLSKKPKMGRSSLKRFFVTYKENIGKIMSVNILMVLGNFPIFFLIAALGGLTKAEGHIPFSDLFHSFGVIFVNRGVAPDTISMFALGGLQEQVLIPTVWTYVFYVLGALTLFTFGIVNVGTAYILRNIAKGEPVFVWTDFWYAVKRNFKQAFAFGIIDALINALLIFNIYNLIFGEERFVVSLMFWANIIIFVLYFIMRFYIYVQMVTFKLTVFKMIKNSLIFALVGMKRNILAVLGALLILLFEFLFVFSFGGVLVSFAIVLPLTLLFSTLAYMKVYASYFKIEELMIEPYYAEHPDERPLESDADTEVLMRDDVTDLEHLEEVKKRNGIE